MSGPLGHQASHGLGTTEGKEGAVQVAQAVLENTAVKTLALGRALSNFYPKGIVTLIEIEMGRHAKVSVNQPRISIQK